METIRIPNEATYAPVSLLELAVAAPLLSRVLLGHRLPGRVLRAAALGLYAGSAAQDWAERAGVRPVDFLAAFGWDVRRLPVVPIARREAEVRSLVERVNEGWVDVRPSRREVAEMVDHHLTAVIAMITGQRVLTSTAVRGFALAGLLFPFALGATDLLSGDIAVLHDTGPFEPHVLAHEFAHRKGYLKELHAQVLAYIALSGSGEPLLVQAALCERLLRQLSVLAGPENGAALRRRIREAGLRPEAERWFLALRPPLGSVEAPLFRALKGLYDLRLRMTGQNGLSDYDAGFTAFLYGMETAPAAIPLPPAGRLEEDDRAASE